MKKLTAILLALSMTLTLLSGCGGGGTGGKAETLTLSPETTSATASGVTVDMGGYVLDGEAELTVQKRAAEESKDEGYKIESYDIAVGELTELADFITIRIPYDESYCEKGQDAALCVGAKYWNEATGEWEDVLYEVDAEAKELVIYTDHLSVYGAFHVKNEGQRRAYITDVYSDMAGVDMEQAIAALQEYVANGGEAGAASAELAARFLAGTNMTADVAGNASFATDLMGNIINFATLGHTEFDSPLAKELFDELGNTGKLMAAVKIGAVMLKSDKTDEDVLGLYKDTANLAMSFSKSKALGMAMTALFVFDYTISEMFSQGMAMKRDKINAVYIFFNDQFEARISENKDGLYKARDLKDWRAALIKAVEENPQDPAKAVEAEIDRYCNACWNLNSDAIAFLMSEYEKKGTVADAHLPKANSAEAKQMTADYKNELYERLYPVINSVAVYMQKKAEKEYLDALYDLKAFLNQTVTLSFSEELAEGESPRYKGYVMRFEPLSEGADAKTWTTSALGDKGATGQTKFTLIGFLTAGAPDKLALYKPGDTPGEAEPEVTASFTLSAPVTEVKIGGKQAGFAFDNCDTIDYRVKDALKLLFAENGSLSTGADGSFAMELPSFSCVTEDGVECVFTDFSLKGTTNLSGKSEGNCTLSFTLDTHSFASRIVAEVIQSDVTEDVHFVISGVGTAKYKTSNNSLSLEMPLNFSSETTSIKQETRDGKVESPLTNKWSSKDVYDGFYLRFVAAQ